MPQFSSTQKYENDNDSDSSFGSANGKIDKWWTSIGSIRNSIFPRSSSFINYEGSQQSFIIPEAFLGNAVVIKDEQISSPRHQISSPEIVVPRRVSSPVDWRTSISFVGITRTHDKSSDGTDNSGMNDRMSAKPSFSTSVDRRISIAFDKRKYQKTSIFDNRKPSITDKHFVLLDTLRNTALSTLKHIKLRNLSDDRNIFDYLHYDAYVPTGCTRNCCTSSTSLHQASYVVTVKDDIYSQAKEFLAQYYISLNKYKSIDHKTRKGDVAKEIKKSGTYELNARELTFGAKLAWRNAQRCIGRIQWSKLQVFDARGVTTVREMFIALCNHIKYATNDGNIRSAITIFPQRMDWRNDFRIWNKQLIGYAGYLLEDGTVIGDQGNLEFTQLCVTLGWKPKLGKFDILPLLLSVGEGDPQMFEIPKGLVLEIPIVHPNLKCIADLELKWYALPVRSSMMLECGGQEFTACAFNGWYMGSEIGARCFCDPQRYNLLPDIAEKMGLDVTWTASLWKDRALLEINVAVLHSFQRAGVTISDHHVSSDSFVKHMGNESRIRGGCPADWVWIVPPMGGSTLQVFHQEMLMYRLKPSFEYQEDPWLTHIWRDTDGEPEVVHPLIGSPLFSETALTKAIGDCIKCLILYASETGISKFLAEKTAKIYSSTFDTEIMNMTDYHVEFMIHQSIVIIIACTYGNGDPPFDAQELARSLYEMKNLQAKDEQGKEKKDMKSSFSFGRLHRLRKRHRSSAAETRGLLSISGLLQNVKFSVFAVGSRYYPRFSAFGKYMDGILYDLGAERLHPMGVGDAISGLEDSFIDWTEGVFKAACDTFSICEVNESVLKKLIDEELHTWKPNKFRQTIVDRDAEPDLCKKLSKIHGRKILPCILTERCNLQANVSPRHTILLKLNMQGTKELPYIPGDCVSVYPANSVELVESVLEMLNYQGSPDQLMGIEVLEEATNDTQERWVPHFFPVCSLRSALTYFVDLSTPPTQTFLADLATLASDPSEKSMILNISSNNEQYETWKLSQMPNIYETLRQFPSCTVPATFLLTQLPFQHQRYYSISSSQYTTFGEIQITVSVIKYKTPGGKTLEGVCSGWLHTCEIGTMVPCSVKSFPRFHMPEDTSLPILMVAQGSGIAPFRAFWQERAKEMELNQNKRESEMKSYGEMTLYFGCRSAALDNLYGKELKEMEKNGVLTYHLALSKEHGMPKVYVQDMLRNNAAQVVDILVHREGHIYVCGGLTMAHSLMKTVEEILCENNLLMPADACKYVCQLQDNNFYHEVIFGLIPVIQEDLKTMRMSIVTQTGVSSITSQTTKKKCCFCCTII